MAFSGIQAVKQICFSVIAAASLFSTGAAFAKNTTETTSVTTAAAPIIVPETPASGGPFAQPERRDPTPAPGDAKFRALFSSWTDMERDVPAVAIPTRKPLDIWRLSSDFGIRNDPFSGRRARHNGVDIPAPRGTPIYATADGVVGRAQWVSGYGKYVEINHGATIQTRYGHMSEIAAVSGQRVRKGDIIGYVGSTGRSTGNHLHYEVRINGTPVNPVAFVQTQETLASLRSGATVQVAATPAPPAAPTPATAQGGPSK